MQFDISFDDADSRPRRKVPSRFAAKMRKPETEPSGNAEKNVGSSQPNDPPPADTTCAHAVFLIVANRGTSGKSRTLCAQTVLRCTRKRTAWPPLGFIKLSTGSWNPRSLILPNTRKRSIQARNGRKRWRRFSTLRARSSPIRKRFRRSKKRLFSLRFWYRRISKWRTLIF